MRIRYWSSVVCSSYLYYQNGDYALASAAATHYIHLYPRALHVDHAYYMVGVANFEMQRGTVLKYLPLDNALRDTTSSMQAYNDFVNFIHTFQNSPYVRSEVSRVGKECVSTCKF